jgi:hypothetical protein
VQSIDDTYNVPKLTHDKEEIGENLQEDEAVEERAKLT